MEERNDLPLPTPSLSLMTTGKLCELAYSSLNVMRLCDCDLSPPLRRDMLCEFDANALVCVCVCVCARALSVLALLEMSIHRDL